MRDAVVERGDLQVQICPRIGEVRKALYIN